MGLYERHVLPWLVHMACRTTPAMRQREKIVPLATGTVLEIGFGSGLNLPSYRPEAVDTIYALEPSAGMWGLAEEAIAESPLRVEPVEASAESVPLPSRSIDTVLATYTLCTVPDVEAALAEVERVLRPGGRLLFCEHGEAPDRGVRRWQRRLNPVWKLFSGGCHLDRPIPTLLEKAGFRIDDLSTMYLPGWKLAAFNFWGSARPVNR